MTVRRSRRGTGWARVAFAIGLALTHGCTAKRPPPPPPGAFFWELTGADGGSLYLLGSVHLGDGRALRLDPRIEADWAMAEELVVEVDTRSLPPLEALETTQRHGLLPPDRTLRDVVSPDTWQALVAYLRDRHYPLDAATRMRPWLLARIVAQLEFEEAGYRAENGVDAWFLRGAAESKPVVQLESLDEQMALFGDLPDPLQEKLLRDLLRESDTFLETTHAILRAWELGDEARLLELLLGAADDVDLEAFHQRVFVERNRRMSERLTALARDGRARFVVIGTGHLIGPESVPELLAAQGFAVTRLRDAFVRAVPAELEIPVALPAPAEEPPEAPAALPPGPPAESAPPN